MLEKKIMNHCIISIDGTEAMNQSIKPLTDQCISIKCPLNLHAMVKANHLNWTDMNRNVNIRGLSHRNNSNQQNEIQNLSNGYKIEQLLHTYCIELQSISTQLFRFIVHYKFKHMYINTNHLHQPLQIIFAFANYHAVKFIGFEQRRHKLNTYTKLTVH